MKLKTTIYNKFTLCTDTLVQRVLDYYKDNLSVLALFGSSVRGDLTLNSDIDLLVILQHCQTTFRKRVDEFYQNIGEYIADDFDLILSPIIVTIEEAMNLHPIFIGIMNNYKILYDVNNIFVDITNRIENLKQSGKIQELELNGRQYWRLCQ